MRRLVIGLSMMVVASLALLLVLALPRSAAIAQTSTYSVWNLEYALIPVFPKSGLIYGQHNQGNISAPMNITLIKGNGRTIVFDAGFTNPKWIEAFAIKPHVAPGAVLRALGVDPASVDTLILSHLHFDHAGGMREFPNATIYVQRAEVDGWRQYEAMGPEFKWLIQFQDPLDTVALLEAQAQNRVVLVDGDTTILPGIDLFVATDTHTPASQWATVATDQGTIVLAADDSYMYANVEGMVPIGWATGSQVNTLLALAKMKRAAGGNTTNVIPGHDHAVYGRFPSWAWPNGLRVAQIALSGSEQIALPADLRPLPTGQAFLTAPVVPQPQCPPTLTAPSSGEVLGENPCSVFSGSTAQPAAQPSQPATPAPAGEQAAAPGTGVPAPSQGPRWVEASETWVYVVGPGETLGMVAEAVYGDWDLYPVIYEANLDQLLWGPDVVWEGLELVIPYW